MPTSAQTSSTIARPHERIIVALDVETSDAAKNLVSELSGGVGAFKVGLQLFTASGPAFVRELVEAGARVFLDLKFHDIPNTVAKAGVEAAKLGVWMFNLHAAGGREMLRQTVAEVDELCAASSVVRPKIIGVTVLTSSDANSLRDAGIEQTVEDQVLNLAQLAAESGLDGIVASPLEAPAVRSLIGDRGFLIVTPGVRPEFATNDDQKRITTPGEALSSGADYLVIGRPILRSSDRRLTVEQIVREVEAVLR